MHTLDDLENLYEISAADQPRFASEISRLLLDPEPLVRSAAAACLGRLGRSEAVAPLVRSLGDPSKIVWRSAAWALRQMGNHGTGIDAIKKALGDPDPRVRRGATRIFAYQFAGMDRRLDLADQLRELTRDPDLWTRLQALRSLRQWFYRAGDLPLQRRIVATYLERMAEPDLAVVRKNLSEGLYIMLDENLGGAISLQRNIADLPEKLGPEILEARKTLEREALLIPILAVLERGNVLQRTAVLNAFDGTFLKGRHYARQPESMADVGNDREFGFLYDPPLDLLERTFSTLLVAELPPEPRQQAIQLCSFFKIPERTGNRVIQGRLLAALSDPDAGVSTAARTVVERELSLAGSENDPGRLKLLNDALTGTGSSATRSAVLAAIGRTSPLGDNPVIKAAIRSLLPREDAAADLLPVLGRPEFTDSERQLAVKRGWDRMRPPQRINALDLLFAQPALMDQIGPGEQTLDLLRRAATDPSGTVRQRAISGLTGLPAFWSSRKASQLVLIALADDAPAIRKLALALAASKSSFWERPDSREHLARLLLDPDASVRSDALDVVKHNLLIAKFPALALRVKALTEDPALRPRAEAALRAAGLDPAGVRADLSLSRPRLPDPTTFRRTINPILYQEGETTYACARCHASHTILRIVEVDPKTTPTDGQVLINYNSVLKVVNVGQPESSLILRKPLSPQTLPGTETTRPAVLTHAGGQLWNSTDHPAYKAILAWIREATPAPEATRRADSENPKAR